LVLGGGVRDDHGQSGGIAVDAAVELVAPDVADQLDVVDVTGGERLGRRHGQGGAVHDGPDRAAGCRLGELPAVFDQRRFRDAPQARGDVRDVAAYDP